MWLKVILNAHLEFHFPIKREKILFFRGSKQNSSDKNFQVSKLINGGPIKVLGELGKVTSGGTFIRNSRVMSERGKDCYHGIL